MALLIYPRRLRHCLADFYLLISFSLCPQILVRECALKFLIVSVSLPGKTSQRIGLFARDKSSLADHLLERQRKDDVEAAASAGLIEGADLDGRILGGPFGGAHGDGVNRHQGSYATAPAPRVPPTFKSQENPVLGEHWADAGFFAGFGPMYGP